MGIFSGEAGGLAGDCSPHVAQSFNTMRMIVTVGWAIYPLGYLFGYLLGAVDDTVLNVVYNIADVVNKIAFVCACWSCAKADSEEKRETLMFFAGSTFICFDFETGFNFPAFAISS